MTSYKIAVLKGDGIGPEVIASARQVLETTFDQSGVSYEFVDLPIGIEAYKATGRTLPPDTLESMRKCDGWMLGPLQTGSYPSDDKDHPMSSGKIRKHFDLFANIRPVRSYFKNSRPPIDLVIVRENSEGFFPNINLYKGYGEFWPDEDTVISLRVIRRSSCRRIARTAFDLARARQKKRLVTAIHKSNVLMDGDGLFLEETRKCQQEEKYSDITLQEKLVDATAMELVMFPERFDVLVTTNLFGDILSDEASALVGGVGLAPSLNASEKHAMAQAVHGTAPNIAGKGLANPVGEILSSVMLLDWLYTNKGHDKQLFDIARTIERAVTSQLASEDPKDRTMDLMGQASTEEFTSRLVKRIQSKS